MMKYTNLIKLLSVLLCAIMLFTACNGGGNAATDAKTGSDATTNETGSATDSGTENNAGDNTDAVTLPGVIGPVEPILKNFFTVGTAPVWKELGVATRLDGDCVSKTEDDTVIVLRKATIDHLNNVKETFTVYNTVLATTVLTLEHSYENGNYGAFSWNRDTYSNPKLIFPDTKMKVEVDTVSGYGEDLPYIKVSKATIVAIDEKVFEENEGNSHEVKFAYDYYDIGGQLITSSDID